MNPNGWPVVPNQIAGGGISTFVYDGTAFELQSISGSVGIAPAITLNAATTLTVEELGALVELDGATYTTTTPTPVGNTAGLNLNFSRMATLKH